MSFELHQNRVPTSISGLRLRLYVERDSEGNDQYQADYRFVVADANGNPMDVRQGDLIPQLTSQERTGLQALLTRLRTRAETVIGV